ncbi:MAG: hypothetical protein ACI9P7_000915 [Candidatus Azotimanducaceae bacterium]|jgi:hypothetical protein
MKRLIILVTLAFSGVAQAVPGDLYIYPASDQDAAALERDRYECYLWASKESGFDPSQVDALEEQQLVRIPVYDNPRKGATGKGILLGAIAGVALEDSRDGAALGAIVGSIAGAVIENQGRREAREAAQDQVYALLEHSAAVAASNESYRRAFTACLEGREYVVR